MIEINELDYRLMARRFRTYRDMPPIARPDKVEFAAPLEELAGIMYAGFLTPRLPDAEREMLKKCKGGYPLVFAEKPAWLNDDAAHRIIHSKWLPIYWVRSQAVSFFSTIGGSRYEIENRTSLDTIEYQMPYPVWEPLDPHPFREPHYIVEIRYWNSGFRANTSKHEVWAASPEKMLEVFARSYLRDDDCDGQVLVWGPGLAAEIDDAKAEVLQVTAPDGANVTEWFKTWAKEHLGI